MSLRSVEISDVVDALEQRGFKYASTGADGWLNLSGVLMAQGQAHPCELAIDPKLSEIPRIRLTQLPATLPTVVPHLAPAGHLCYLAKGSAVFDLFDPVGQTLACVEQAEKVLGAVLTGKMIEDLADEFFAYWGQLICLVDLQGTKLGRQEAYLGAPDSAILAVVTDDHKRTNAKLKAIGWQATEKPFPAIRVKTHAKPRPDQRSWPPKTIQEVLAWQAKLDPRCKKKIEERLSEAFAAGSSHALVLIESPSLIYGFATVFQRSRSRHHRRRSARQHLYPSTIHQLWVTRIDDRYIAQRNLPGGKTLAGLRIGLVGCGTIGGYLAEMLVKGGAGTSGGRLTLVDHDTLGPQNLGRHRLGFSSLFKNKAQELRTELLRSSPGVDVGALPVDARAARLDELDLLIDAAGEQGLSDWMSWRYHRTTPLLSVWVEGAGLAVRTLLKAKQHHACPRCLSDASRRGNLRVFEEATPTLMHGHGCEGLYVPFPASASVQAASLAAEMVHDWVNDVAGPTLRTRVLDRSRQLATPDCSPSRAEGCPACSS